uniref:Latent transforming growth factor beta binding protein 4 n=1 Tax=Gopherus evgoodei TaxID=1825980 RepID=A0A8C4YJU6_9SAUR
GVWGSGGICGPGRCGPRQGSYTCLCHPGFWLSTQGTHCIDMDECRQRPRPCANGRCENTVGSFRCVCAPGYRAAPPGPECRGERRACPRCLAVLGGWGGCGCDKHPPPACPCSRVGALPRGEARSLGAVGCARQPPAVTLSPLIDVDECRQTPRPCSYGRCENTPGSYRCVCPAGFRLDPQQHQCQDIDECAEAEGPPALCLNGRCLNTDGSYRCLCPRGYVLSQPPPSCIPARPRA